MNTEETLRFFHIVLVLAFFSGTVVVVMTMGRAARESNIHTVRTLVRMAYVSAIGLVNVPLVAVGVLGVALADEQGLSLTDTDWLNAAYAATAVAFALTLLVMGRRTRHAARLAERDLEAGAKSAELEAYLNSPIPRLANGAVHALVAYIIVLMVYQPF